MQPYSLGVSNGTNNMASSTLIHYSLRGFQWYWDHGKCGISYGKIYFWKTTRAIIITLSIRVIDLAFQKFNKGKVILMCSKVVKIKNILKMKIKSWKQKMLKINQYKPYQRHYFFKNIFECMHKWMACFYIIFFVFVKSILFQKHMILNCQLGFGCN